MHTLVVPRQVLEDRLSDKKEALLEKELVLEEVVSLTKKLRKQATDGRAEALLLSKKVTTTYSTKRSGKGMVPWSSSPCRISFGGRRKPPSCGDRDFSKYFVCFMLPFEILPTPCSSSVPFCPTMQWTNT